MAPLERLKILMQVQGNEKVYTGVWQGLVRMVKTEGVAGCFKVRKKKSFFSFFVFFFLRSLFFFSLSLAFPSSFQNQLPPSPPPQGNWTNCVRIIPNSAVKFLLYEQLSRSISHALIDQGKGDGRLTPGLRLGAGAVAGIVAMSATYPLDMVRGRLTVQGGANAAAAAREAERVAAAALNVASSSSTSTLTSSSSTSSTPTSSSTPRTQQYRGIAHAARTIAAEEGLVALWRGWLPSVIGVVPYVGLNFAVYETLKDLLLQVRDLRDERQLGVVERLACGAAAGTTGQTVAYPLDVVRRRMQMSGWDGANALHGDGRGHAVRYTGMSDCFRRTVAEEGVRALFKGLWPNYIKVVPSIAIAFVSYEQLKEAMGVQLRISS